jgi:MFS superfamily sulfate permease-like transporter
VFFAVWPLLDLRLFKRLYEITRTDGIIALATFSAVFVMRPDEAILSGVILALVLYIRRVMWTDCVEVGIHPVWNTMHMREGFPEVAAYEGVMMLRIDAPLFYASIERLARDIEFKISTRERENAEIIDTLVLDFSGVTHIDVTGLHDFDELLLGLQQRNVTVYLIELKRDARAILGRGHLLEKLTILNNVFELTEVLARRVRAGGATKKHFV